MFLFAIGSRNSVARSGVAVDAGEAGPAGSRKRRVIWRCRACGKHLRPRAALENWTPSARNKPRHRSDSPHERRLKLMLKPRDRARLLHEDLLQMLHRLQHRFRLRAHRWSQRPAQPGTHHRQAPAHAAHDGISRLQRQRPGDRLHRPLQRHSREPLHQQPPQPRSRHRVPWQNVGQEKRKRPAASATLAAPGTIRPLPALTLGVGRVRIIARKQAVAIERAAPSAMRTRPALQRKSSSLNSWASRTKQKGARDMSATCCRRRTRSSSFFRDGTGPTA